MGHLWKAGESAEQFAIRRAFETGHFWSPDNPNGANVSVANLALLKPSDAVVRQAFRSFSRMMVTEYAPATFKYHNRAPHFDGELGPALATIIDAPRCDVPDYRPPPGVVFQFDDPHLQQVVERLQADPVRGTGNWYGCHQIGDWHCAVIQVDESQAPVWMRPLLREIVKRSVQAYDEVGLHFIVIDASKKEYISGVTITERVDIQMKWVPTSDGWIGLAIVGNGLTCSTAPIWCYFLNTFTGGTGDEQRIINWTTLIKHEWGHNVGLMHTPGGVMNASIVFGLPISFRGDTSWNTLVGRYGGVAYVPGTRPPIPPTPVPGTTEDRLRRLEQESFENKINDAVQDAELKFLRSKIKP